ncbi:hypothetical protein E1286_46795 [Nonomuraea terrae]|uniref:Uncharacterized protein n=1 Tax=Nonomuraea terrae TaxID=2530383 RepID=A0A4R4XEB7_9ACTN|nr:hypothetical protein [Nonomuraea terrae]TDD28782.1 hypothetical protein E1286_46795 [Nonomuraea terrae]
MSATPPSAGTGAAVSSAVRASARTEPAVASFNGASMEVWVAVAPLLRKPVDTVALSIVRRSTDLAAAAVPFGGTSVRTGRTSVRTGRTEMSAVCAPAGRDAEVVCDASASIGTNEVMSVLLGSAGTGAVTRVDGEEAEPCGLRATDTVAVAWEPEEAAPAGES